jgi:hypothetical protein
MSHRKVHKFDCVFYIHEDVIWALGLEYISESKLRLLQVSDFAIFEGKLIKCRCSTEDLIDELLERRNAKSSD